MDAAMKRQGGRTGADDNRRKWWWMNHGANPWVKFVLMSPMHRMFSGKVMLVRYTGLRSGKRRQLPVMYATAGETVWAMPSEAATKAWWRNMRGGLDVTLRMRGRWREARATAVEGSRDAVAVAEGLRVYVAAYPAAAARLGLPPADADDAVVLAAAAAVTMVRFDLRPA